MPNVKPLSEAFTARLIGFAWNEYKEAMGLPPYLGRSFFGTNKQTALTLAFIKGGSGLPVALKASNFDAQAPLRDGIGFSTVQNEMPFFRESYMVTEKQKKEYDTFLNSTNIDRAEEVLSRIAMSPMELIKGANVVPERMIWQLMAPADGVPRIKVFIGGEVGQGYTIEYTGDSGAAYKATNFMEITSASAKWSVPATATPIVDILAARSQHRTNRGEVLGTFIMNDSTWQKFCNAEDTRKQVLGAYAYSAGQRVTEQQVKDYLLDNYRITILVYNTLFQDEAKQSHTFIPDGIVTALPENKNMFGTVWYSTTPEEDDGDASIGQLSVVETGVAVYNYTTPHPINYHCVVSEIVLPSYEGMDSVFVMKVDGENLP